MSETPKSSTLGSTNKLGRTARGAADQLAATQAMIHLVADMRQGNYLMALESGAVAAWAMTDLVGGQIRQQEFFQTDKTYLKSATLILEITNYILAVVDQLNGSLPPDEGDIFLDGAKKFDTAGVTLSQVNPENEWRGDGSEACAALQQQLMALVQEMAEVDREMQHVLVTEAQQVDDAHLFHRAVTYSVVLTTPVALALYAKPIVGPEISRTFQKAVARHALGLASERLIKTADESTKNAAAVKGFSERYKNVFAAASILPHHEHDAPVMSLPNDGNIPIAFEDIIFRGTPNTQLPSASAFPKGHISEASSPGNRQAGQIPSLGRPPRESDIPFSDHHAQKAPVESEPPYWLGSNTAQAG